MILGFTGSQQIPYGNSSLVQAHLEALYQKYKPEAVVTGGCIGIDAFVYHWFRVAHPEVRQVLTLPGNKDKVSPTLLQAYRVQDTVYDCRVTYRARNEHIVELCDLLVAFWTGKTIYSGTWMTMNIAYRAGKLLQENIFALGNVPDESLRNMYMEGKRKV